MFMLNKFHRSFALLFLSFPFLTIAKDISGAGGAGGDGGRGSDSYFAGE